MTKETVKAAVTTAEAAGVAITRRDLISAAAAFALTASGKIKPLWEGTVPGKVLDIVDSFGDDSPADRHALLEAAALAGILISSRDTIEDIEKTLTAQVKKQAGLFACRDKEAIDTVVNGEYKHPKLTPEQAAEVNGQAARRISVKPTDFAKAFGVSTSAIARQVAGPGYGAVHQA